MTTWVLHEVTSGSITWTPGTPPVATGDCACGAQEWAFDDDGKLIIYGTCNLPVNHETGWHNETRNGQIWAQWRGPHEARAPQQEES